MLSPGIASTVRKLKEVLREQSPAMVFLSETKCGYHHIEVIKQRLELFGVCVPSEGCSGGLALLWRKDIVVELRSFLKYHIDLQVLSEALGAGWRFTGFYGDADTSWRKIGWRKLTELNRQAEGVPWLCAGDFNEVLYQHEKTGIPRPLWQLNDFRHTMAKCNLNNIGFQEKYPDATMTHRANCNSDHRMLLMELTPRDKRNKISRNPTFALKRGGYNQRSVNELLRQHGPGWVEFEQPRREIKQLEESKEHWLANGYGNTRFFHSQASAHKRFKTITRLRNSEGMWTNEIDEIQTLLRQHFRSTFASCRPANPVIKEATASVPTRVTMEMNSMLTLPFTAVEKLSHACFKKAERRGRVQGVAVCAAAPKISHLLFVDDTLLFCKAKGEQIEEIQRILTIYERASGQVVNFAKSNMIISGRIGEEEKQCLANRLGVRVASAHDRYLGLLRWRGDLDMLSFIIF
ncbi:UNVERIFIED_CONTAM: hypothetical protein Scaly_2042500 [Sesamum calycinum]|uniref:Endonuclease/exonuclease/phosphatase domain-containing protein n=1 Tax=Sesamum calycinum TaxID=2727403 RepID=A0AAW2N3W2_9LAMI